MMSNPVNTMSTKTHSLPSRCLESSGERQVSHQLNTTVLNGGSENLADQTFSSAWAEVEGRIGNCFPKDLSLSLA